jgi:hypothetical protein
MKTVRLECDNRDSCTPGTSHLYPVLDETVRLSPHSLGDTALRRVGGDEEFVNVNAEAVLTVLCQDAEAHQVMVSPAGVDLRLWLTLDDIDWPEDRADLQEEEK